MFLIISRLRKNEKRPYFYQMARRKKTFAIPGGELSNKTGVYITQRGRYSNGGISLFYDCESSKAALIAA